MVKANEPSLFLRPSDVSRTLCKAFNKLQMDDVPVSKAVKHLRKLHHQAESDEEKRDFFKYFVHLLRLPLSRGTSKDKLTTYDEKIFEVVCQFATSFLQENEEKEDDKENNKSKENADESIIVELPHFLRSFFNWLLDHHEMESSGARLKVCLLVNRLLKLLGEEAEIDDELYQKIYDNMLERLKDKVAEIRAQAVNALQRLQDPSDEGCPIIKAFIFHMGCDPSPIVRKAIVRCIGATRLTLPHILKRTLDVDENVRKAAYKFIADKVHIRSLTIAKREEIIRRGLTDRNDNVRKVVAKDLVPSWLRFCNASIVELLYALDVGNSDGKTAKEVLTVLFNGVPYEELVGAFQYLEPNTKLIPHQKLSPETATYWRNLATYLHNESEVKGVASATPFLEDFMPELTQFCNYVRQHFVENRPEKGDNSEEKEMIWLFNGRQLIEMFSLFDLADVAGRNNLLALVKELLLKRCVPHSFVEPLTQIHRTVQTNPQQRIQDIAEIISELRDPMKEERPEMIMEVADDEKVMEEKEEMSKVEKDRMMASQNAKKVEIAKIRVKLNILQDNLDTAIREKDFMKAQNLQLDIDEQDEKLQSLNEELALLVTAPRSAAKKQATEKKIVEEPSQQPVAQSSETIVEDPEVVHKCLVMLFQLLQSPDISTLNATLQTVLDEFVKNAITNLDLTIKIEALKTLAAFCLRSLDLAKMHILLFSQIALVDVVNVRVAALEAIFDLLMWYGVASFTEQESMFETSSFSEDDASQSGNPIVSKLSELLDDRDLEVRTKVTEGLCKLMMSKVITSSKLFTRLILMWYNPVTDANGRLRHVLGAFFPLYASMAKENQVSIADSFMPTMKTISSAPVTSPLTEVDLEDVGLFLIQLTNNEFLQCKDLRQEENCHDGIAYAICNQIISEPLSFHVKLYTKLLGNLNISSDDFTKLRELKALHQQMAESVKDKICLKTLEKFGKRVEVYLEQNPDKEENEESKKNDEEVAAAEATMNNTTKMFRKRALFSQTCNTLLEENPEVIEEEKATMIRDIVVKSDEEEDDLFATPKAAKVVPSTVGEIEITRIEESPLESEASRDDIVSGNMRSRRLVAIENTDDLNDSSPTTSTQIERRSSKRLSTKSGGSTTTEDESEDSKSGPKKRNSRGKVKPAVEPIKPQRKSRRIVDSSTGSSEEDASIKATKKRTRK